MNRTKPTNKEMLEQLKNNVDELKKEEFLELLQIVGSKKQELFDLCGISCEDESISFKEFFRSLGMELLKFQQVDSKEPKQERTIVEFQVEIEQEIFDEDGIEE